ncbi:MAG: D-alanine-D-alanine ligase [Candidatus Moranbacteria bacterium GW2011_GWE1_35_17]|nr:MAG: D-alanine-D-alanine ligase [Candidatus Moranbacteria bacterium GW2011_GWE2_35_164]KKP68668.1 MAG: D-alanine-D-alanine ligase [Candidatus Moranbacteria bacterium GW2011_GWE1_35_17]KKP84637.1 MAG: D-alanine-D-alanine ligase [Candidatus Moranbacteria bacterium GW2011_GWF1_35_5]KKP85013.1 MAG: D-alanine-D-alanine ligase [Candidatus Moranbacteria bacterium GW2011_GWF2_35_54]
MQKKPFTMLSLPTVQNTSQIIKKFPFPIELTKGKYRDIEIIFHNSNLKIMHQGVDIKDFSFVWLSSGWNKRDIAYAISLYLQLHKTPHSYAEKNSSKVTDCMVFAINNLPMPNTLFISRKSIEKNIPLLKEVCGFPLIIKDIRGCRGKHSAYANNEQELLEKIKLLPESKNFLFQGFIANEYDWGVMIANGVVVAGEKSYPKEGEFLNNSANGARELFVDVAKIPPEIKEIAIKANNLLGLSWSRADIIIDKVTKKPYLLEVNRFPGITSGSNEVTGAYTFLASHILK